MYQQNSVSGNGHKHDTSLLERIASSTPKVIATAEYVVYMPIVLPKVAIGLAEITARYVGRRLRGQY
ncbi:hypothetical protein KY363_04935 [Candidatus Woesearchaeota archaeon]|nr:hypothetical protein [Candidatus Woesearchaeota archaeon]